MRTRMVVVGIFLAVAGASPAFGQALAEGAMVHANSAAAGVKAGTALGNALNKATGHIAQQMHTVTQGTTGSGKVQAVPRASKQPVNAGNANKTAPGGSMITSIRGAQKPCAAAPAAASPQSLSNCAVPGNVQSQSKSVVNVTFPQ
jgi:hypothetical protein